MSLSVFGQQSMFKALFMFNFTKYIEWPNQSSSSEFIIGVFGNDDIVPELQKLAAARKINGKSIIIKSVKTLSEASGSHLFYVPSSKSNQLNEAIEFFNGKQTLLISEDKGACQKGTAINYIMDGGKMKYEICKKNILSQKLNVDQKLIALGIEVK